MCEREGELTCPFLGQMTSGHYRCDLPGVDKKLMRDYLNQYCLRPHYRRPEDLSRLDVKGDSVDRLHPRELPGKLAHLDDVLSHALVLA